MIITVVLHIQKKKKNHMDFFQKMSKTSACVCAGDSVICFLRMVMVWSAGTTCLFSWNCLLDSLKHQSRIYFSSLSLQTSLSVNLSVCFSSLLSSLMFLNQVLSVFLLFLYCQAWGCYIIIFKRFYLQA